MRPESPVDIPAICQILEAAFGQHEEASLVAALRRRGAVVLELKPNALNGTSGLVLYPAEFHAV